MSDITDEHHSSPLISTRSLTCPPRAIGKPEVAPSTGPRLSAFRSSKKSTNDLCKAVDVLGDRRLQYDERLGLLSLHAAFGALDWVQEEHNVDEECARSLFCEKYVNQCGSIWT